MITLHYTKCASLCALLRTTTNYKVNSTKKKKNKKNEKKPNNVFK